MDLNLPQDISWDASVKQRIRDAVLTEAGKVRICQKAFPTRTATNGATEVPFDVLQFGRAGQPAMRIPEGETRNFIELALEFPLTLQQAMSEPEKKCCETLARMAAKAIALAEDVILFQGARATLPALVTTTYTDKREPGFSGLLGAASPEDADDDDPTRVSKPINVSLADDARQGVLWGENTFTAVAEGISKLVAKAQAPEYALFLPTKVYADTFAPPGNQSLVTTSDRIKPLVLGGFHMSGGLPPDKGLLAALGGEPTTLYVGREPELEYNKKEGGDHLFRVVERVQFVPRDPRALVLLTFEQPKA